MNWYGIFFAAGFLAAYGITLFFLRKRKNYFTGIDISTITLLIFFGGIIGARALFVLYHLSYFIEYPGEIPAIWHGGWVWHGALIGGGLALALYARMKRLSYLLVSDLIVPGVALAQGIGRWGNYANQEAYGLPTNLPWGIAIDLANRVEGYEQFTHFHPTFLYESLWDFGLFLLLFILALRWMRVNGKPRQTGILFALYLILYSVGRFAIEMLRIDTVPVIADLRTPQWISLVLIGIGLFLLTRQKFKER